MKEYSKNEVNKLMLENLNLNNPYSFRIWSTPLNLEYDEVQKSVNRGPWVTFGIVKK